MDDAVRQPEPAAAFSAAWPPGSGEMARLIRDHDWAATPLGPAEGWPERLKAAVEQTLASGYPSMLAWGPELVQIYNDPLRPLAGAKHPGILGRPIRAAWPETWAVNGPLYARALGGETVTVEDMAMTLVRGGVPEEAWFTGSFSPVRDESGAVAGVMVTVFETTGRVRAERKRAVTDAALRASEERYRSLFDSIDEGFCIVEAIFDADGRPVDLLHLEANQAYERYTGVENIVGRRAREIVPDLDPWLDLYGRVALTGEPARLEVYVPPGLDRWISAYASRFGGEGSRKVAIVFNDITDRKRAEQELVRSNELLRTTFDSSLQIIQLFKAVRDARGAVIDFEWLLTNKQWNDRWGPNAGKRLLTENPAVVESGVWDRFLEVLETGAPITHEHHYAHEQFDGWFLQTIAKADDGILLSTLDITDAKRAEMAVRASEARYRTLFETMDEGFVVNELIRDDEGRAIDLRYLELNPAVERLVGWSAKDTVGRHMSEMIPAEETKAWVEDFEAVLASGASRESEHYHESLGMWFRANATPVGPDRVALVYQNTTAQKRAELALRESEERQAFLLRFGDALRAEPDADAVARRAIAMLLEHLGLDRCYVATFRMSENRANITHQVGGDRVPPMPPAIRLSDFPEALRINVAGTLVIGDVAGAPGLSPTDRRSIEALGFGALVAATLRRGENNPLWTIVAVSASPRRWTPSEVALAEEAAERTWAAVERARAEGALREREERLGAILETARDYAILTTDAQGRIETWSKGAEAVLGWRAPEVVGEMMDVIFTPEDRAEGVPERERRTAREQGQAPDVRWHLKRDGSRVFIDGATRPLAAPDGSPWGFVKVGQDVTDRRATEEALRKSESRFRQFAEASSDVLWIRNAGTLLYEYVSPAFEAIYGADLGELLARNDLRAWAELVHPDDRERAIANLRRVRGGERVVQEFRIRRASDGAERWVRNTDFPLRDEAGRVERIAGIGQDVTELKRAEAAVAESERRFRGLVEAIADVFYVTDLRERRLDYLSPTYERVWGRPAAGLLADLGSFADTIHPDDRGAVAAGMADQARGEPTALEYRILRPDGAVRWIADRSFPVAGEEGRLSAGLAADVTDAKLTALRLRSLVEGVPQLVWRAVDGGHWTWASPQWQAFTGQSQEESHGLGWLDALHPEDRGRAVDAWAAAAATGGLDVEYRLRRASDGVHRWFATRATVVRDPATGAVVEWLGTSTDVHDLKELQERQAVLVAELQHRTRNLIGVVRSIATQTMARTGPTEAFREEFNGRLAALARVQGLLSRAEQEPITLRALLKLELDALGAEEGERVRLDGPPVRLRPSIVQTLALALHELATNARKHGALANGTGRLAVDWDVRSEGSTRRLHVEWREEGPARAKPAQGSDQPPSGNRDGYGRQLIERALPYALGAETTFELGPVGLLCTIDLPLDRPEPAGSA